MFGMSGTELAIVLLFALLLLGPKKLPELARGLGKGLRDFRRATNDLRDTVETEIMNIEAPPPEARRDPASQHAPGARAAEPAPALPAAKGVVEESQSSGPSPGEGKETPAPTAPKDPPALPDRSESERP